MKKPLSFSAILFFFVMAVALQTNAQEINNQVITVSGGSFGTPGNLVRFQSLRHDLNRVITFDSIPADFTTVTLSHNGMLYSNAGDSLVKHNLNTYQRLNTVDLPGTQALAVHGNKLLVGRGFGVQTNVEYLSILSTDDLSVITHIPQIPNEVKGIAVLGDTAYVSHNLSSQIDLFPPWGIYGDSIGYLAVIDLTTNSFVRNINLGTAGAGATKVYVSAGTVVSLNYEAASISVYNPTNGNLTTQAIGTGTTFSGAGISGSLVFADYTYGGIGTYDLSHNRIEDTVIVEGSFAAIERDRTTGGFFGTQTDYFSYGHIISFDENGNVIDTFVTGISPESIAIDYRQTPIANFRASKNPAVMNIDTVEFTNLSLNNPAFFHWEFSPNTVTFIDGTHAASPNPKVIFNGLGEFRVSLTASIFGAADVDTMIIEIAGSISAENLLPAKFKVYPNPASNYVRIELASGKTGEVQITDLSGRKVLAQEFTNSNQLDVNVSALTKGMYIIMLKTDGEVLQQRLIKN